MPRATQEQLIYAPAERRKQVYGHGDYGTEFMIVRMGAWGTGDFPPLFTSREDCEQWIQDNGPHKYVAIVLTLRDA